jgi:DNA-binding transcriptional LysR family regulator
MSLSWTELPYFLAAARKSSFRAAGEATGTTHATVRRHVEALEARFGVRLFDRARNGLILTVAGQRLLSEVTEAEARLIRAENGLRGLDREASGLIRLAVDPMTAHFVLPEVLTVFTGLYPDIEFEIRATYKIENMDDRGCDVAIRNAEKIEAGVIARKLFPLSMGVYGSRTYIAEALPQAGKDGEGLTWLSFGNEGFMEWVHNSPYPKAQLRHTIPDPEIHLQMCRHGAGLTVLPAYADQVFPELQRLPGDLGDRRSTWVLYHPELRRVTRVRRFVDYLCDALIRVRGAFEPVA